MAGSVTFEVVTVDKPACLHGLLRHRQPGRRPGRRHRTRPGIVGVIDGSPPLGIERSADVAARHRLLRTIGYKL